MLFAFRQFLFAFPKKKKKESLTLPRPGPFGSMQVPYCTHSSWEGKAGIKESFGPALTNLTPGVWNPPNKPRDEGRRRWSKVPVVAQKLAEVAIM